MRTRFRLTMAQLNPTVGDIDGNLDMAFDTWRQARDAKSDLVAFTEMFATGYQTQDLVLRPSFTRYAMAAIEAFAKRCADGPAVAIGGPYAFGSDLFNAYWILDRGVVKTRLLKHHLPNRRVFDEMRVFDSGPIAGPYAIGDVRIGSPICEDAWHSDVAEAQAESGAELLLVPNGSPFFRGKHDLRLSHMVARCVETGLPVVYLNMVGGQDDQVFDGGSFVLNPGGALVMQMPLFEEAVEHVDFERTDGGARDAEGGWHAKQNNVHLRPSELEQDYQAIILGVRDYVRKSGFEKVLIGLSGGIDSAAVAAMAADAFGPGNVRCVMLPSLYTSEASLEDAAEVARRIGCRLDEIDIEAPRRAVEDALSGIFEGREADLTEENIQSRLRGLLLMALSNKFGEMLLTTGNRSEMAVGYATIYGDMAGGYNPLKDVYKTRLFDLCRWRNANFRSWMRGPDGELLPQSLLTKPPSAELRRDQRDDDSLPPYDVLDPILKALIDEEASVAEIVAQGYDAEVVKRIELLVRSSEYKRRQAAPGVRLSQRSFDFDRRYPIANRWRDRLHKDEN